MYGIDCGNPLNASDVAALKAGGVQFVGRYLGFSPTGWKHLTPKEVEIITSAGLSILSIFERNADRTKGGAKAGYEDGQWAMDRADILGQPKGSAIYWCVDYDTGRADLESVEAYLRAVKNTVGSDYLVGVYGEFDVVEAMVNCGVVDLAWQTLAWSRGKVSDKIQVYQKTAPVSFSGVRHKVDLNDSYGGEGLWGQVTPLPANEEDDLVLKEKVEKLEQENAELRASIEAINKFLHAPEIPQYAKTSVEAAVNLSIINTPDGRSEDFYAFIKVLGTLGLINASQANGCKCNK
jgi:hypothetical protein